MVTVLFLSNNGGINKFVNFVVVCGDNFARLLVDKAGVGVIIGAVISFGDNRGLKWVLLVSIKGFFCRFLSGDVNRSIFFSSSAL